MRITILIFASFIFLTIKNQAQTVTDFDGNVYNTINIGTQLWMSENLKVTHYRNGDTIPNITVNSQWGSLTTGAYGNYDNDTNYADTYGHLYNWYAVINSSNICPEDWHIPTDAEWTTLSDYLGGENVAGGKMKEAGTVHWTSPNTGATNTSGFTGLPGGIRSSNGYFYSIQSNGYWWSSTESSTSMAWRRKLYAYDTTIDREYNEKSYGFSVRCICDSMTTLIDNINYKENYRIYPNPTNGIFTVEVENIQSIEITNEIGQAVFSKENVGNNNQIDVDINNQPSGIYFVRILINEKLIIEKLIINNAN